MNWRRVLVTTVLVAGCTLGVMGCGDSESGTALSTEDWVTIEGDFISLSLPPAFNGGDPNDQAIAAAFDQVFPGMGAYVQSPPEGFEAPLIAWMEPGRGGSGVPSVWSLRTEVEPATSMEDWIEDYFRGGDQHTVESLSENWAYVVTSKPSSIASGRTLVMHCVFLGTGSELWMVVYGCEEESAAAFEPIFRASAKTIVIEGWQP